MKLSTQKLCLTRFFFNPQRKFLLLLCFWRGLGHKLLHSKFQTCSFLRLAAGAAKVTCPTELQSSKVTSVEQSLIRPHVELVQIK